MYQRGCTKNDPCLCKIHGFEAHPWMKDALIQTMKDGESNPELRERLLFATSRTGLHNVVVEAYAGKEDQLSFLGDEAALSLLRTVDIQHALFAAWLRRGGEIHNPYESAAYYKQQERVVYAKTHGLRVEDLSPESKRLCPDCGKFGWKNVKVAEFVLRDMYSHNPEGEPAHYWYRCPQSDMIHTTRRSEWEGKPLKPLNILTSKFL